MHKTDKYQLKRPLQTQGDPATNNTRLSDRRSPRGRADILVPWLKIARRFVPLPSYRGCASESNDPSSLPGGDDEFLIRNSRNRLSPVESFDAAAWFAAGRESSPGHGIVRSSSSKRRLISSKINNPRAK